MRHLFAFFFLSVTAFAQEAVVLSGIVRDASTGETLASANIRVLGTGQGTVANAEGSFRLVLGSGRRTLVVSSIGYRPDTLRLVLTQDVQRDVALVPSEIILPEVIVTSEDPAIEIIRRAIANKRKWIDRLKNFEMDAFTRQVLRRDTAIASITESFTKGYWQQGDTLREIVKQKRQTENIKSEFNFASVGRILNFNDDEIKFIGYTFIGPTATDALEYYDYKLLRTRSGYGKEIYEIRMIPRTRTRPLFEGTINIAGDSYALMGVDVRPNEAFSIPFVQEAHLRYRQQFGLYENSFWMPADIRIDASARISVIGFSFPPIGFSQTSVISQYVINTTIPDSIFSKPRLVVDSLAVMKFDSTFWQQNNILPLTLEEQRAYRTLDSTQTLDVQFRRGGFSIGLGEEGGALSRLDHLDLAFNRVEGLHLGVRFEEDSLTNVLNLRGGFAYGFSYKRSEYTAGVTLFVSGQRLLGFGGDVYRRVEPHPDEGYYGAIFNSLTCLFAKNDYEDYYASEGWRVFAEYVPSGQVRTRLAFSSERHRSVAQHTNYSFFARGSAYRPNPPVSEGKLRSIRLEARIGPAAVPLDIIRANSIDLAFEFSSPHVAHSDFDFTRASVAGTMTFLTFGRSLLLPAALSMKLSAGVSSGSLPEQLYFDLESASSNYAPFGVFRAMDVKEFSGTRYVAINLEHNFRTLPFLALGIPFLYQNNIEFLMHGGAARTWNSASILPVYLPDGTAVLPEPGTTGGWYGEAGFGFSRIFDLIRADFTWRLSSPGNFRFTLGVANLF